MERKHLDSVANFAAKFCQELGTDKTSVCSPLSAELVLALLALGCKEQSHAELLRALGIADNDAIRSLFSKVTTSLQSIKGATLNVANKVYLKKGGELKPGIKKDAEEVFQSSLEQLDFKEQELAAAKINDWVAKQTNYKITEIVTPDMMTEDTRMVMVNAIYFQGLWSRQFYESATRPRPFHVNDTTTIHVAMMSMSEKYFDYGVSQELKAKLLKLSYQGDEASMVIVLPDEVEGLKEVMQKLASGHNILGDIKNMRSTELDVMIPKFRVETTIDLKKMLPKLGIQSIFDEKSDIDMLTSNEKLFVSDAIQKALIIVDEKGTEAAACTMVCGERFRCIRIRQRFVADRPFLYLLTARQIPLFIGVYEGSKYAQSPPVETVTNPPIYLSRNPRAVRTLEERHRIVELKLGPYVAVAIYYSNLEVRS